MIAAGPRRATKIGSAILVPPGSAGTFPAMTASEPVRKRLHRWEVAGAVRFITFSCHRRLPLLDSPGPRDLFAQHLAAARAQHGFDLFAWVVMPEHVHLLVRPRDAKLADALRALKTSVAKRLVIGTFM